MLKRCFVPSCLNNSQDSPSKLFLSVPKPDNRRKLWFKTVGVNYRSSRSIFCCEDHFNLPIDAENWVYFKTVGGRILLYEHVVPHLNLEANSQTVDHSQLSLLEKKLQLQNIELMKVAIKEDLVTESTSNTSSQLLQNTRKDSATTTESSAPFLVGFLINDTPCLLSQQNNISYSKLLPTSIETTTSEYIQSSDEETHEKSTAKVKRKANSSVCEDNFETVSDSIIMQKSSASGEKITSRVKRRRKSPIRVKHDFSNDDIYQKKEIKFETEKSPNCVNNEGCQNNEPNLTISSTKYIQNSPSNHEEVYQQNIAEVEKENAPICVKNELFEDDVNSFKAVYVSECIQSISLGVEEVYQNNITELGTKKSLMHVKKEVFGDDETNCENVSALECTHSSSSRCKGHQKSSVEMEKETSPICVKKEVAEDDTNNFVPEYIQRSSSNIEVIYNKSTKLKSRRKSPIRVKIEVFEEDENNFETVSASEYIQSTSSTGEIVYLKSTGEGETRKYENCMKNKVFNDDHSSFSNDELISEVEEMQSPVCVKNEVFEDDMNNFQLMTDQRIKIEEQLNTELIIKEENLNMDANEGSNIGYDENQLILPKDKKTHTKKMPYACDVCDKTFIRKLHLKKHIKSHQKSYSCNTCDKTFFLQHHLIAHKRTHTGEKPYMCDDCGQKFTQKGSLVIHQRKHTGVKPYSCDFCDKAFAKNSYLTSHIRTHTGEKPYKCDVCERKFSQYSTLKVHKLNHTGERPYVCDTCDKTFTKRNYLVIHKIQHIGSNLWLNS